jgi:protein TonB
METPPAMNEMDSKRIALETVDGKADHGMIPPTSGETGTVVFSKPEDKKDDADIIIMNVDIQASFPGGLQKWSKYIQTAILNELDEFDERDYGTCVVKFIVDKTGKVSDVEATTMKGTKLAQVAVNAIRKGPNWIPAEQNGRKVNAYRLQPVTLRIADR